VLAKDIQAYPVDSESQSIRTIGLQQRQNNRKINKLVRDWTDGLGYSRLRRDANRGINGLRDADAETRFGSMLTLPLNPQAQTHADPADHLISYVDFRGNLVGVFEDDYNGSAIGINVTRNFNAGTDTWDDSNSSNDPTFGSFTGGLAQATSISVAHTPQTTYGNRLIVAFIGQSASIGTLTGTPPTYGGAAMTLLTRQVQASAVAVSIYYLINPESGESTCVATSSATDDWVMIVADFYHCDQVKPFRSSGGASGASVQTLAVNTIVKDDDLVIGMFGSRTASGSLGTTSGGTGQTLIRELAYDDGLFDTATSYERAGANSLTFDHSGVTNAAAGASALAYGVLAAPNGLISISPSNAHGIRVFDTTVHKGSIFTIMTDDVIEGAYQWSKSSNGATWVGGNGSSWPASVYLHTDKTRVNNWAQKYAAILGFGTNIIVAIYEDPDSAAGTNTKVRIGYSDDSGATWTFHANLVIPCTDTPNISLISARDIFSTFGATIPALVTSDNIYLLDITNDSYQAMLPSGILGGTANEALAVSHASDASIYVSKASGDILRIAIPSPGVIDIRNIGPNSRAKVLESDGLVAARQGHANFMWGGDPRWLFVAYGGHASGKNGSVLCFDYVTGAWHSFYRDATADRNTTRIIGSDESDGVSRLHITTDAAASSVLQQFEEPYVSAATGATQQYRSTGYVEWAEDDLGDPHADSAILTIRLDADGLDNVSTIEGGSGTSTDVEIEYGVNGAAWDNVSTLGLFGSDDLTLFLGKTNQNTPGASEAGTPVGISAKTFRMRAELKRDGTVTNTPKIKEVQTEHINKSEDLNGFVISIDVGATAQDQQINPEVVLDRIDTIKGSVISIPLEFGQETDGTNTTYYVEHVRRGQFDSEGIFPQGVGYGAVTEKTVNIGTVTMYLEERIDV
jgi:hypothetical protein